CSRKPSRIRPRSLTAGRVFMNRASPPWLLERPYLIYTSTSRESFQATVRELGIAHTPPTSSLAWRRRDRAHRRHHGDAQSPVRCNDGGAPGQPGGRPTCLRQVVGLSAICVC